MISKHAIVDNRAKAGEGCSIWHWVHIREESKIGDNVTIGANAYIDHHVEIGSNSKIGNGALIYYPAKLGEGVFIGPQAMLINDKHPRAIDEEGNKLGVDDWEALGVIIEKGASIGAGAIILPGIRVGAYSMIGAGTVVSKDVPAYTTVVGATQRTIGVECNHE